MSPAVSLAFSRAARTSQWAPVPWGKATFFPFRSATVWMGESLGTRIETCDCSVLRPAETPTILIRAPADWAKIGGASPVKPRSTAPALIASSIGGPPAKELHSMS